MKLDKLFQSLLITGGVVLLVVTSAKAEEVREDGINKFSTQGVGKSTLDEIAVTQTDTKLVSAPSSRKPRNFRSQIASSLGRAKSDRASKSIPQLSEIEIPATSAQMLVQTPTPTNPPKQGGVVPITGVKANPTDKGLEVILETTEGDQLQVTNRSAGNNFIADITGGQLRLASGDAFTFRSEKPIVGITEITITNVDANTVRVTVVGEKALPAVELFDDDNGGLVFAVPSAATATQPSETPQAEEKPVPEAPQEKPAAQQDEPIELVVTGERDGYRVQEATTATRTDTPLRDIPQSIQVVPRQVLEDRKVRNVTEAVETVSGVVDGGDPSGTPSGARIIRGFAQSGNFRNGFRDGDYWALTGIGTTEQVEVLKGPASVLFGAVEPGGIVNVVTKKPLSEPYYNLAFEAGNRGFYQPSIDLSGPLNTDKTLLYRFNASYQGSNGFQDFVNTNLTTIAPTISLKLGDRTDLNLYYEYINFSGNPEVATVLLSNDRKPPRNRYVGYPDFTFNDTNTQKFGYTLNHKFNDNWQIRNNFSVSASNTKEEYAKVAGITDDRFLNMQAYDLEYAKDNYFGQIDLVGKFKTGAISHQLLVGFDFNRFVEDYKGLTNTSALPDLDILNPNYNVARPEYGPFFEFYQPIQSYGIYLQDQIALLDNLKLLIGGRFDWVSQKFDTGEPDTPVKNDSAFSPRIGLVYQPSKSISLYTSYTQAFNPTFGFNADDRSFKPSKGTQYEAGIKTDFLEGRLSATLAVYQITKTNITTPDPDPDRAAAGFSIQVGEQKSQGIELDIGGEILPGWKVIASYAYTNAEVSEDNLITVGDKLRNVPSNQASLWTTYEIQKGDLEGLGFGLGLFYVGTRPGDLPNTFELGDYLRTDAAIYYRRDGFNAAINIRNLFDTYYVRSSESRQYLQIGAPFTIIGSIGWEF